MIQRFFGLKPAITIQVKSVLRIMAVFSQNKQNPIQPQNGDSLEGYFGTFLEKIIIKIVRFVSTTASSVPQNCLSILTLIKISLSLQHQCQLKLANLIDVFRNFPILKTHYYCLINKIKTPSTVLLTVYIFYCICSISTPACWKSSTAKASG